VPIFNFFGLRIREKFVSYVGEYGILMLAISALCGPMKVKEVNCAGKT
jgi:hypothetical protein